MRNLRLIVFALILAAIPAEGLAHTSPRLYELYSWPQTNGNWYFSLLPTPSRGENPVVTIFSKKYRSTGIDQLERKISRLPTGTRIIWMTGIKEDQTPTRQSRELAMPPLLTVEQVTHYAEQYGVHVQAPGQASE